MLRYSLRGAGETIVFLYGALVNRAMWDAQMDYFSAEYQALAVDLPEHGESMDTVLSSYRVEMIAEAVMALLDSLQIERFHLCGHSLGGMRRRRSRCGGPGACAAWFWRKPRTAPAARGWKSWALNRQSC